MKLFIIEDNLVLQRLYKEFLCPYGFEIMGTAKNGKIALESLKQMENLPDLIIMDHNMPVKNGIETTMEIKTFDPEVKIFFVSGNPEIKELALSAGAIDFLEKPFDFPELIQRITRLLNRGRFGAKEANSSKK
ncbi:MAG: response regulator [Promethearchaeia archaeon]